MEILKHKENYIKVKLANGNIVVIDNTKDVEGGELGHIALYASEHEDDTHTPTAYISEDVKHGFKSEVFPEEHRMSMFPGDQVNLTTEEYFAKVKEATKTRS